MVNVKNVFSVILIGSSICFSKAVWSNHEQFIELVRLTNEQYEGNKGPREQKKHTDWSNDTLVYQPPMRGAPSLKRLIGAGTRTAEQNSTELTVVAPDHVGLTVRKQPVLYWYIAEQVKHPLEFIVIQENANEPLLEIEIAPPIKTGFQRLSLSDFKFSLEKDIAYQWSIALVINQNKRSADIASIAAIKYMEPSLILLEKLKAINSTQKGFIYAQEGIWYDALHSLSESIEADPENPKLRDLRARLLGQVGLKLH